MRLSHDLKQREHLVLAIRGDTAHDDVDHRLFVGTRAGRQPQCAAGVAVDAVRRAQGQRLAAEGARKAREPAQVLAGVRVQPAHRRVVEEGPRQRGEHGVLVRGVGRADAVLVAARAGGSDYAALIASAYGLQHVHGSYSLWMVGTLGPDRGRH